VIGSGCSAKHSFDKIVRYIAKAKEAGAEILVGGNSTTNFFPLQFC